MRELGLALGLAAWTAAAVVACQSSEPARANPPSSATNPGTPIPNPGQGPPAQSEPPVYDETVQSVDARAGGTFTIALPANVSTPLEWKLDPEPNPAVLGVSGRKYTDSPPPGCRACTGYPGTDAFTFAAKAAGEAVLHFAYVELRKGVPPAKELTVRVRVIP